MKTNNAEITQIFNDLSKMILDNENILAPYKVELIGKIIIILEKMGWSIESIAPYHERGDIIPLMAFKQVHPDWFTEE